MGRMLVGQSFGLWTVVAYHSVESSRHRWACLCECGTTRSVLEQNLINGSSLSCGCHKKITEKIRHTRHGQSSCYAQTGTYQSWAGARNRCRNPACKGYKYYGGRGITFSKKWDVFEDFVRDMGIRPSGLSLDRIRTDGNYEPGNCRWATRTEQANNRRNNKHKEGV